MIKFKFELCPEEPPLSGFEMGNLMVDMNGTVIDSKTGEGRYLMMLFVSIVELLNGLNRFLGSKKKMFKFVGVDSSFIMTFEKMPKGIICIHFEKDTTIKISRAELIKELAISSYDFWESHKDLLNKDAPILEDIDSAVNMFMQLQTTLVSNE